MLHVGIDVAIPIGGEIHIGEGPERARKEASTVCAVIRTASKSADRHLQKVQGHTASMQTVRSCPCASGRQWLVRSLFFSSPKLKAKIRFPDHLLFLVCLIIC